MKHAEDIICLLSCIKNESIVPRTVLKNGKRQKDYLNASRRANLTLSQDPTPTQSHNPTPTQSHRSHDFDPAAHGSTSSVTSTLSESVRAALIMKDVNLLKKNVDDLKRDVSLVSSETLHSSSQHLSYLHHFSSRESLIGN